MAPKKRTTASLWLDNFALVAIIGACTAAVAFWSYVAFVIGRLIVERLVP